MLSLEKIRKALKDRRIQRVSEATGIHHNTIAAIRDGRTKDPSHRVIELLSTYLKQSCDL